MTINDILDISAEDFLKLSEKELRQQTSKLASAANKRLQRFASAGIETPATQAVHSGGGKFTTTNKSFSQLRSEHARARRFLMSETSTAKGYKKVLKDTISTLDESGINIDESDLAEMWKTYNKIKESNPALAERNNRYQTINEIVLQMRYGLSRDEIVDILSAQADERYEQREEAESDEDKAGWF